MLLRVDCKEGGRVMSQGALTNEERRCLQMWFRQAIARLEQEEAASTIIRRHGLEESANHRSPLMRRRSRRNAQAAHGHEAIAN